MEFQEVLRSTMVDNKLPRNIIERLSRSKLNTIELNKIPWINTNQRGTKEGFQRILH